MILLTALLGKAKLYLIAALGIAAVMASAFVSIRRSGAAAERQKQIRVLLKNRRIASEEIDAARRRTVEETKQRLKDTRK